MCLLDFITRIGPLAMTAEVLLGHARATSPLPLDTTLAHVHYNKLEMICLDLFSQTLHMYMDSCKNYKQVAPLIGEYVEVVKLGHL